MRKRIVVTVISDLVTDQRVHKVCQTLRDDGYEVQLIGTRRNDSQPVGNRDYRVTRIRMLFQKKALFYAEFNSRLFIKLLFSKATVFLGNDLDVMPATYWSARIKKIPVVYDSHEYFLGMPGLDHKRFRKNIWTAWETLIFSKVKYIYTVSDSIRDLYKKEYNRDLMVVRNLPAINKISTAGYESLMASIDRLIPKGKKLLLYQGAGINPKRGAEELMMAMKWLDPARFHLLVIGGGENISIIKGIVKVQKLEDRVLFIDKIPFAILDHFTRQADLGISIDKPDNVNQYHGLPNKIFEYLHAAVPVLVSRLPEQEKIIHQYRVGDFIENHEPEHIACRIKEIFDDPELLNSWKINTINVRETLNWEQESKIITDIFKQVERERVI